MTTSLSTSGNGTTSPRRHRYGRSSTTSVTQLLSDGYSNIINKLTRRGPSEKPDPMASSKLSTARSRYDDKLLTSKNSTLANVRRYENNRHISPYASFTSSVTVPSTRKFNEDRAFSSYLSTPKSRIETSPVYAGSISGLGRNDSFRRAHLKDNKSSPFSKRYPLTETNNNIESTISLGSTRSRLEDKYSSVLDKIASQKKERAKKEIEDRDKTLEPEYSLPRGGLMRSLTTAVFGENSFRRNNFSQGKSRDKTPFKHNSDKRLSSSHRNTSKDEFKNGYDVLSRENYYGKDRDSIYRRHQRRSLRADKSENNDRKGKLSLRPIDINLNSTYPRDLVSPIQNGSNGTKSKVTKTPASSPSREVGRQKQIYFPSSDEDDDKTPTGDSILSDRETRRKEIQSLIMKYAHLDEVYDRINDKDSNGIAKDVASVKRPEPIGVGDVVMLPPELRSRHRPQRPRHLLRRAQTPPVSTS